MRIVGFGLVVYVVYSNSHSLAEAILLGVCSLIEVVVATVNGSYFICLD
jgi:hypothetical protein